MSKYTNDPRWKRQPPTFITRTQVVTVPALTDVTVLDRLVIAGVVLEVQLVRMRGEWAVTKRCECREAV